MLRADTAAARHFLIDGNAPQTGDVMRFPALAATLRAIAAHGPQAFYQEAARVLRPGGRLLLTDLLVDPA